LLKRLTTTKQKRYTLNHNETARLQSLINIGDIMDNIEHENIVDFIESLLALDEVDKEIEEDINPIT
jgi:hypothetical protein